MTEFFGDDARALCVVPASRPPPTPTPCDTLPEAGRVPPTESSPDDHRRRRAYGGACSSIFIIGRSSRGRKVGEGRATPAAREQHTEQETCWGHCIDHTRGGPRSRASKGGDQDRPTGVDRDLRWPCLPGVDAGRFTAEVRTDQVTEVGSVDNDQFAADAIRRVRPRHDTCRPIAHMVPFERQRSSDT